MIKSIFNLLSGENNADDVSPDELFQVKIPVVDSSLCFGTSSQICAGVIGRSPKGSCFVSLKYTWLMKIKIFGYGVF